MLHKKTKKLKKFDNSADIVNTTIYIGVKAMGLAASQGRFLALTARNNDLVYEGQQISQQRLALADKTQELATKYSEAMNNKKMQAVVLENGSEIVKDLSYDLIVNQDALTGLGMRIIDSNGNVVIPGDYLEMTIVEADKPQETRRYYSAADFIKDNFSELSDEQKLELSSKSMQELKTYYDNVHGMTGTTSNVKFNPIVGTGERTHIDPDCLKMENGQTCMSILPLCKIFHLSQRKIKA